VEDPSAKIWLSFQYSGEEFRQSFKVTVQPKQVQLKPKWMNKFWTRLTHST
jgi:hypothetical protein